MKNKKIILIEPYTEDGAHSYKHITLIPKALKKNNVDFNFIVNKDASVKKGYKLRKLLHNSVLFASLNQKEKIKVRIDEYKKLILNNKNCVLFFLTVKDVDFYAIVEIFCSEKIRKIIKNNGLKIYVHSAYNIYPSLFKLSKKQKACVNSLKSNVVFTFYSDYQVYYMKKSFPEFNTDVMILPMYDEFYEITRSSCEKYYVSYLGLYNILKRPYLVLDCVRKVKADYFIHLFPIGEGNLFLLLNLLRLSEKRKGLSLHFERLSAEKYLSCILKTKVGFVPYDDEKYALQASGILEEYVLAGIPVIVPDKSWLSSIADKFGAGYVAFEKEENIAESLRFMLDNYKKFEKLSKEASHVFYDARRSERFLDIIFEGKSFYDENFVEDNFNVYLKGIGYLDRYYKLNEGVNINIEDFDSKEDKMKVRKANYWLDDVELVNLKNKTNKKSINKMENINSKKRFVFGFIDVERLNCNMVVDLIMQGIIGFDKAKSCKKEYELEKILIDLKEIIVEGVPDLAFYSAKASDKLGNLKLSEYFYRNFIKRVLLDNVDSRNKAVYSAYRLVDICGSLEYLKKLLSKLEKVVNKTSKDFYWMGGLSERLGNKRKAVLLFKRAIRDKFADAEIKARCYFRIGNILFQSGKKQESKRYLKLCLKYENNFLKAKELLEAIN